MPSRRHLLALPVAAALGAVALPASDAGAATLLRPLKPCYVTVNPAESQLMRIEAAGFEPLRPVDVRIDDALAKVDADAAGIVRVRPGAPYQKAGERTVTVTLTEDDDPLNTVTATTKVTALSVRVRPRQAATSSVVRFRGRGFTRPRSIYGHYVLRGRARKTVRFAPEPTGDCGTFSVRRKLMPMRRPRPGDWTLQVDQQRTWSERPEHSAFVPVSITVRRIIGEP